MIIEKAFEEAPIFKKHQNICLYLSGQKTAIIENFKGTT
jgi:hypothetical protein